jgi:hypothetical protein
MGADDFGGGLWVLVVINSVIFIAFAASFFRPRGGRDWRAMGIYSGFAVALFTEMYGFPLTIFLLSGWLGSRFPELLPTHAGGHVWNDLIGWTGDPHLSPFHLASYAGILAGFWLGPAAGRCSGRRREPGGWPPAARTAASGTRSTRASCW